MITVVQSGAEGYSFIHIPKNAGTTIIQAIAANRLPVMWSGHTYPRQLTRNEVVVLRCPIRRFSSAFYYAKKYWPNPVNSRFGSASELAECAADQEHPKYAMAVVEMGNQPEHYLQRNGVAMAQQSVGGRVLQFTWAYEPQSSWLINQPQVILRHRHLQADFSRFASRLTDSAVNDLPQLNVSNVDAESLSPRATAFLERIYAEDFAFIRKHELDV